MFSKPHCPVIAIEEHYWDEELAKTYVGGEAGRPTAHADDPHRCPCPLVNVLYLN